MRILYAEDEADLNDVVSRALKEEHFLVDSFLSGRDAIDAYDAADYDVVILDVMMPGADGYEVMSHIRRRDPARPILLLTAKDAIEERVRGLDAGANDYLVKPFSLDELLARVRVLTRAGSGASNNILRAGDLELDTSSHIVKRSGRVIDLTAKEYQLLEYLMYNKGSILSRGRIEDHVWDLEYEGGTNVVDVYIRYLRQKIDAGYDRKLIHTKRGLGYMLSDE